MGVIYIMGKNVKQDYLKAKNYFEKAAKYGSSEAFFALGGIYEFGLGVEQNCFIAKSHYEFSANKNNSDAQFRLGNCYMYGLGCEPDVNKAILNYELSSKQNNMSAILTLGYLYEEGFGVKQDYSKAIKYYQLLANQDNSDALNCLGIIYLFVETEKDYLKAKFYLESAAKLNNSKAMCNLGYMHYKGFGVEKNYLKAKEYFELSAEQSNRFAYIYLAELYEFGFGVKQDYLKAKEYLEKAAKANDPYAFEKLGYFYINGYGVEQNFLIAKDYFELSIRSYNPSANFILADFFSNGFIFEIDYFRAIQYLMKSIAIHDGKVTFYEYSYDSFQHINVYNKFYYHSNNSLGLIYMIQFQDLEKANIYIKEAAFGEYPFAQNNYGLLKEIYFNKIDDAKYMYKKSAKKKFALADFNLAKLYEKQGKIEKSIKHYIIASENEDSPLIFHNFEFFDILLFISTIFIMCFTNLKLTEYYFSKSNFKESKKYFLKAFAKFNLNDPKTTYQFKLVYHKGKIKDIFTYIKKFILNFPLFHQSDFNLANNKYKEIRTQQVNQANSEQNVDYENSEQNVDYENSEQNNDHENSEQNNDHEIKNKKIFKACQKENFDIKLKSKQNDYLEKINQYEFYENEMQINEDKQTFVDLGDLYDFMISDTDIKKVFINEIKIIIDTMKDMIYTPPYHILFGRIENDKHKKTQNSNETVQNINELFYEGLELEELIQ